MKRTGRLTASVVAMAVFLAIGAVAAFAEVSEQEPSDAVDTSIQSGSGDDYIETVDDPAAPTEVREDVISCGDGMDTVVADSTDVVAADCESVERLESPAAVDQDDRELAAFNCDINAQNPHKSRNKDNKEVMVAKGRLECATDSNRISLGTQLSKWKIDGWNLLLTVGNTNDEPRPAAETNLRWGCKSNDDFWFKNYTKGIVSNNGNRREYVDTNVSDRKWRC